MRAQDPLREWHFWGHVDDYAGRNNHTFSTVEAAIVTKKAMGNPSNSYRQRLKLGYFDHWLILVNEFPYSKD